MMQKFFSQNNINFLDTLILKKKIFTGGFTLIETLVAISIFTISVLALIVILSQGLVNISYAKQKIIAGYLAQEGVEYIRNMRDTYVLYSSSEEAGWNAFRTKLINMSASCQNDNGCYFDDTNLFSGDSMPMTRIFLWACYSSSCSDFPLYYDPLTGKYGYDDTKTRSSFSRQIKINQITDAEIKVTSTVFWTQRSGSHNISFSESLFNWME